VGSIGGDMISVDPQQVKSYLCMRLAAMPYKPYGKLLFKIKRACFLREYRDTIVREAKYLRMLKAQGIGLTPEQESVWKLYRNYRDRQNELNRRYYPAKSEYFKNYYLSHKDELKEYQKNYYQTHKGKVR